MRLKTEGSMEWKSVGEFKVILTGQHKSSEKGHSISVKFMEDNIVLHQVHQLRYKLVTVSPGKSVET